MGAVVSYFLLDVQTGSNEKILLFRKKSLNKCTISVNNQDISKKYKLGTQALHFKGWNTVLNKTMAWTFHASHFDQSVSYEVGRWANGSPRKATYGQIALLKIVTYTNCI